MQRTRNTKQHRQEDTKTARKILRRRKYMKTDGKEEGTPKQRAGKRTNNCQEDTKKQEEALTQTAIKKQHENCLLGRDEA